MPEPSLIYAFEGVGSDLPRPPMAALRGLLSAGVLVSARAWAELPTETRLALTRAGAADRIDEAQLALLLKQVPVSQVKFIGRRVEPSATAVPPELAAVLGPMRPMTMAEWTGLRALDRYVLVSLVNNSRLLAKALNEMLPQTGGAVNGAGVVVAWSGLVARCELRMRREVVQKALSSEFMGGRAFILANVAGRRAARRSSELLDMQAESTVGPVEVDWGLRQADDVIFWQAHVSAWDGTFFPVAAMLAANTAATAMYDMIRAHDPGASIVFAGVREEPWQAGRDQQVEPATALYRVGAPVTSPAARPDMKDTVRTDLQEALRDSGPRNSSPSFPDVPRFVPPAVSSSPALLPSAPVLMPGPSRLPSPESPMSRGAPPSSGNAAVASGRVPAKRPAWVGVSIVGLVIFGNLIALWLIAEFLAHHHH